jgi:hypothetical protein
LGLTAERLRLDRSPATASASLFPPHDVLCIAKQHTGSPSRCCGPKRCRPIVPGPWTTIEVAVARPEMKKDDDYDDHRIIFAH